MDFLEDLFKKNYKDHHRDKHFTHRNKDDYYHDESDYNHHYKRKHSDIEKFIPYIKQILHNKKLLYFLIALGIGLIIIAVIGIILLMPLLGYVFDYINKNGLKGVIDIGNQLLKLNG